MIAPKRTHTVRLREAQEDQNKLLDSRDARDLYAEKHVEGLREVLNDMTPVQVYAILESTGIMQKMIPYMDLAEREEERRERAVAAGLTREDRFEAQKQDLYKRALQGDITAKKLWFELESDIQTSANFNVIVKVSPYRIEDPSLKTIITQAAPKFVQEMLNGLLNRLDMDEAPHELKLLTRNVRVMFEEWARVAYAAKDA